MRFSIAQLLSWIPSSRLLNLASPDAGNVWLTAVETDSRQVHPGCVFVALRGERFDAHDFIADVVARGATVVMVERPPKDLDTTTASTVFVEVPDTRIALAALAAGWRSQFAVPVIAVTGSNGKTTVKEMIAAILAAAFGESHRLSTQGNLNNEIGVPKTLLRFSAEHRAAVIELGMNHPGEIAVLAAMAAPTVALVNNAQREHQEFMNSVAAVAEENGAVLQALTPQRAGSQNDGVPTAVFPANDPYTELWRGLVGSGVRCLTFGLANEGFADVSGDYHVLGLANSISVNAMGTRFEIVLNAAGEHNVRNALAATACALAVGIAPAVIQAGLKSFTPVAGRLQHRLATLPHCVNAQLIDDTYNANPDSVLAAFDVLAQQPGPHIAVLGDMGEVGSDGVPFHIEVGAYARQLGIAHLLTLGDLARHASAEHGVGGEHFDSPASLLHRLDQLATPDTTILIKGSRFMKMERIVAHLTGHPVQEFH